MIALPCTAFSSHGRHNVRLTTLKTFAEYNERSLLARLSQLEPCGYSRLGAAIRHGASIIDQSGGTTRRLLIVVSDGLAFDHGYDLDHGARDVRRALAEVRSRGTGCLCLTVGATAPSEDLRLVFGTAAHAAVPGPIDWCRSSPASVERLCAPPRSTDTDQNAERTSDPMPPPNAAIDISSPATERPFYHAVGNEERVFAAAFRQQLPVLLKGPTGCGKTRFVEAMAHEMGRPLITVACHDDLTTADLVGRFLLRGGETEWVDGPLTRAVREGAICYLDEVVEARQDTTVVLHPLADHRRTLPIERLGETLSAAAGFCLVVSYNPGYQSVLKDLKDSTRQRMVAIQFDYPHQDVERMIVQRESGIGPHVAEDLVRLAQAIRRLDGAGLQGGLFDPRADRRRPPCPGRSVAA